ncbi:MAG: D-alanyl-D-alanine carboxypeptidase/D-alanyl-D-alanine-endopeptidase [Phycisphaerales bacterium]|nr:D-alanyl-D-alanine carboxypeptidase/D-alanyl-D-alanine-endopeptidase [Phycisphaerales bacterium]
MPPLMRLLRYTSLMLLLVLILAPAVALAGLQADLEATISKAKFSQRHVSVAVRECGSPNLLASISASTPRIPASNQKLLTSGAAALVLGADFRFTTQLLRSGENLIVLGDGDPALGDDMLLAEMQLPDGKTLTATGLVDLWAASVAKSGMKRVDTLIVDDRVFDREWTPAEWPAGQLRNAYCAQVGGVNFNHNTVKIKVKPTNNAAVVSDMRPPYSGVILKNTLKRVDRKKKLEINPQRTQGTNTIRLSGNVPVANQIPIEVTIDNPPLQFGTLLADRLRRIGIAVSTVRLAATTDPPATGKPIAPPIQTELADVLRRCNHESENMFGEALLKRIAYQTTHRSGTRAAGSRIVTGLVETRTGSADGLQVADGSGMSSHNRISARTMTSWLCSFDPAMPNENLFIESLSLHNQGKVQKRLSSLNLHGTTVRVKSGYISKVYTLAGYVECPVGRRVSFSIMINTPTTRVTWALRRGLLQVIINHACSSAQ